MKQHRMHKLLSYVLVLALLAGYAVPVSAVGSDVSFHKVENSVVSDNHLTAWNPEESETDDHLDTDLVRVSVFLDEKSTVEQGFSTRKILKNAAAMDYRAELQNMQDEVTASIERALGQELDVVWNLTLAANAISANVRYGDIPTIEKVPGVAKVILETRYEPQEAETEPLLPNMTVSSQMTGTNVAWEDGYTGAGMRVAIIDTGLDNDHQSVDPDALYAAFEATAEEKGMDTAAYVESLHLADVAEIAEALPQLHIAERSPDVTAEDLYLNMKAPFAYNYIDKDLDTTHDHDDASEHGSHVAGIAAANRYLKAADGTFVSAATTAGVVGNAPDAQIFTMKVFGKNGGAYDSDYMAAIEDAILLDCDAANLSLGSASAGHVRNKDYAALLDHLAETDTVVSISAGNAGAWPDNTPNHLLYNGDAAFHTGGSPGTYKNAFTVASVNNDGGFGYVFSLAGQNFIYSETEYSNLPLHTLDTSEDASGTEMEYVYIEGMGKPEDFVGIDVTGKIVLVSRGEISFFEKGIHAAEAGAAAAMIYNNQPGSINMDLTDYTKTMPLVSITQEVGFFVRDHGTMATSESGVNYYTGTLTVLGEKMANFNHSEHYEMSEFSSWGVPSDLSMKPEITAPGGNIYSINGQVPETDQYELMSGTSMAAPQITGITAIVKQALEAKGYQYEPFTLRGIAQSLMMSTAVPMKDTNGNYYSVLQQGAGLVRSDLAVKADSILHVLGQEDGKVKAELGEDPERTGEYEIRFRIHNFAEEEKSFVLNAEMFTQALEGENVFLSKSTRPMAAVLSWADGNGPISSENELDKYDFTGDGVTDEADVQAILDAKTGVGSLLQNAENADLDGDGVVSTHDARILLTLLGKSSVTVAPGADVELTLTIRLTEAQKEELNTAYVNGAYVEGYVFVKEVCDAEGVEGVLHTIPILGYFGSWTDPSMFDVGNFQAYLTGEETRAPYMKDQSSNSFLISYDGDDDVYYFGGNAWVADPAYRPERNAMNSNHIIYGVAYNLIRNAGAFRFQAKNTETSEILKTMETVAPMYAGYFNSRFASWSNAEATANLNWMAKDLEEGTHAELLFQVAPEYYVDYAEDGSAAVRWEELAEGASIRTEFVVDNTAPVLENISLNFTDHTLDIRASDNQYVAAVLLYNAAGTEQLGAAGALEDAEPGEIGTFSIDLGKANGKKFLVQVMDYANNMVTYEVEMELGEEAPMPQFIAFNLNQNMLKWVGFHTESTHENMTAYAASDKIFVAATIVDHMVFASTIDQELFVMPENSFGDRVLIRTMDHLLLDMAYNPVDGEIYGVGDDNVLYVVDKLDGSLRDAGVIGIPTNTLACDENGIFYSNEFGTNKVYQFTRKDTGLPTLLATIDNMPKGSNNIQAMEIDPNTGKLYWTSYYSELIFGIFEIGTSVLYEIDPTDGTYHAYHDMWDELAALVIPLKSGGGGWMEPVDQVTDVLLHTESLTLIRGSEKKLTADVLPWTATDRSVAWETSDPSVATVDENGVVTGVETGSCVITATSVLTPSVSAECAVRVETVDITLEGLYQDANGDPYLFTWNMAEDSTWTTGVASDTTFISATQNELDHTLYVMDDKTDVWSMHNMDPATGTTIAESGKNLAQCPLWDMSFSKTFSTLEAPKISSVYGYFMLTPKDPMHMDQFAFNLNNRVGSLPAIVTVGPELYWDEEDQINRDTERVILLDDEGNFINFWMFKTEEGMSGFMEVVPSDLNVEFKGFNDGEMMFCSMVLGNDGNLYLSHFANNQTDLYRLTYNQNSKMYNADRIGSFGPDIWPVSLYAAHADDVPVNALPAPNPELAVRMDAQPVTPEELMSFVNMRTGMDEISTADNSNRGKTLNGHEAGSLNALRELPLEVQSDVVPGDCMENMVNLNLTSEEITHNYLVTVEYDPALLTPVNLSLMGDLHSYHTEDGRIVFGAVSLADFSTEEAYASVSFKALSEEGGMVTVTVHEANDRIEDVVETFELKPAAHQYVANVVEPTCTEGGYTEYVCSVCGDSYKADFTEPLGHDWGEWVLTKESTCTEEGEETRTCQRCGETETRAVPAKGHDMVVKVIEPTCTEEGYTLHICQTCNYVFRDNFVEPLGHDWGEWTVEKEATCTEDGLEVRICSRCGDREERVLPAIGHEWSDWTVTKEANCFHDGEETRTCAHCGHVETRVIPANSDHCPSKAFEDLKPDQWYHEGIDYVLERGIMNGMSDTLFQPNGDLLRGQMVTVLYRLAGEPEVTAEEPFTDVDEEDYFMNAVIWAYEEGITNGMSATRFGPKEPVTREQLVTFMSRYAAMNGVEIEADTDLKNFYDWEKVSDYAVLPMAWAVENGIINGIHCNLEPRENATRAQIATIIMRFCENILK